jgi:uncharacterized protein (DUF1330 family)
MNPPARRTYLEPTEGAGRAFFSRPIVGSIVMLNLMRFHDTADYRGAPHLAPTAPISGQAAYQLYVDQTLPLLQRTGGELLFYGSADAFLIGPADERWDAAMLVRQNSLADFLAFASDRGYQSILAHRTAALEDSRLLPLLPRLQTSARCPMP